MSHDAVRAAGQGALHDVVLELGVAGHGSSESRGGHVVEEVEAALLRVGLKVEGRVSALGVAHAGAGEGGVVHGRNPPRGRAPARRGATL